MVVLGSSVGANPRSTALAHTARLATILIVLPIFINQLPDVGLGSAAMLTTSKAPINLDIMGIFFAVGIFGSIIARFIRIPSPYLLGPMRQQPQSPLLKQNDRIAGISPRPSNIETPST